MYIHGYCYKKLEVLTVITGMSCGSVYIIHVCVQFSLASCLLAFRVYHYSSA